MTGLLKYLKNHKAASIIAPLFKMLEALFDLFIPLLTADIINNGIAAGDKVYITERCIFMVAIGLVGFLCSITAQYFAAKASVGACEEIRHSLFAKINSLGFGDSDKIGTSTLITRMISDTNQVQNGLNMFLRLFLRSPFIVFGSVILAFTVSAKGAVVFVLIVPVLAAIVFFFMSKTVRLYKNVQSELDRFTGITRENLTGARVIRAFGREESETESFKETNSRLTASQLIAGRISALMNPATFVVINLGIVAVLYAGGFQVNNGSIAAGDVVALVNYMNQILIELVKLANFIILLTKATASSRRINAVLAAEPSMRFGTSDAEPADGQAAVEFIHAGLSYGNNGTESISDISFKAMRGETIGIIGGTGSGKTSLVSLIPRYYDATSGSVLVFGKDIRDYSKAALRSSVSTVMQKAVLFSGTVRSNLLMGNPEADDAALWNALECAQAAEFVRQKGGLDIPVEQGGKNFSGGQKQRLSVARSLAASPDILILDDSSSALDYATDAALRSAIAGLPGSITVFIVSQRAGSLLGSDKIIVLDEGHVAGIGSHTELLSRCSVYRDIYESQFGAAGEDEE